MLGPEQKEAVSRAMKLAIQLKGRHPDSEDLIDEMLEDLDFVIFYQRIKNSPPRQAGEEA
jgi:hypothetical protein